MSQKLLHLRGRPLYTLFARLLPPYGNPGMKMQKKIKHLIKESYKNTPRIRPRCMLLNTVDACFSDLLFMLPYPPFATPAYDLVEKRMLSFSHIYIHRIDGIIAQYIGCIPRIVYSCKILASPLVSLSCAEFARCWFSAIMSMLCDK